MTVIFFSLRADEFLYSFWMKLIFILLILSCQTLYSKEVDRVEEALKANCTKTDLLACENLAAYYLKVSNWNNAVLLGDVLCKKEHILGCTFAGTALLAQEKSKEGIAMLSKACDAFEPYACRSLSRLMKKNKEDALSYSYLKRACSYGLKETCLQVKLPKVTYSPAGFKFLKGIEVDCSDSQASACKDQLKKLGVCESPLTKVDCLLLPGELSIYFRAKLIQSEARFSLMTVVASEKFFKETAKTYSYDLGKVLKDYKPSARYHYVFGFNSACRKKFEKGKSVSNSLELYKESYREMESRTRANIQAMFSKGKAADCYDPAHGFEAYAVGSLDPLNPSRMDVWKINRDSDIIHIQEGLPKF